MKKVILFAAVGAFAVSMTSCSKNYTCTCYFVSGETVTEYSDLGKIDAEAQEVICEANACTWAEA